MKVLLAKQWHARWHDQKTARRWENNIKKVMTLGCQSCGYSSYTHYTHTAEMKIQVKILILHTFFLKNGILFPKLFLRTVRKNCFSDWKKRLVFEDEGWEFAKILTRTYFLTVKSQNLFWNGTFF